MIDFLTFKAFISTDVLIIFYYIGAIVFPIVIWSLTKRFVVRFKEFFLNHTSLELVERLENGVKDVVWNSLTPAQRKKVFAFFLIMFVFLELFWRMLFEFLIAYMQIRDALVLGS